MAEVVIKTRITPKKLTEKIVSRGRLLDKIGDNASKNLILVTGPAGYGKTTLVLDFLRTINKHYAWFYTTPDIDNFYTFVNYLIHSLKNIEPAFGEKTLELAGSFASSDLFTKDESNSVNGVVGSFVNEFISAFTDDTFLVIDDLHNISGSWLNAAFNNLVESFPENLHIIITSRTIPDFNLAKLRAKRNLLEIESRDLNFSNDETESLLKDIYSISYNKKDVGLLISKIEGWITGLHLVLQAYGIDFPKIKADKQVIDEDIFSYFAEDIFNQLDENTRDFMISTSLLDTFTAEMCEEVLGLDESKNILNDLKRKNLFIESSQLVLENGNQATAYSYHNLFKQFLVTKLNETKSKQETEKLAGKIFKYYLQNNDYTQAIEFCLYAKEFSKASELLKEHFDSLFHSGRYELLWKWLQQFPDETISSDYELLFLKARLLRFYKNELDSSYKIFAEITGNGKEDIRLYVMASSEISEILQITGKPEEALNIFKELYELDASPELKVKIIISLAKGYYRIGSKHYDEIIKLLDEALLICEKNDLEKNINDIYSLYGRVYLNRGDFIKSLHYLESTIKRESNIYKKFQTINNIVLLFAWSGQYKKAKEYYDNAAGIYANYPVPLLQRDLVRLTGLLKFEAGDYEDAIEKFLELVAIDTKNNFNSYLPSYYLIICESYILLNELDKANEYLLIGEKLKASDDEHLAIEYSYHKSKIEKIKIPDTNLDKILSSTIKFHETVNSLYNKTQVQFHIADYYLKKGNSGTSLRFLLDCLTTSSEKQYNSFLAQHFIQMRYLFDFAAANNIQKDYINTIYNTVFERNSYTWLSDECRNRLKNEKLKLYDIYLSTFGGAEILVRGNLIPEDKWIRKKSKLLFVYLLINQGVKIQKDKVLGLFFSELSSSSAENVFHQAITNIRNAVKPESEFQPKAKESKAKENIVKESKGKEKKPKSDTTGILEFSPSYIIYEDKILQMSSQYNYKVDVIEFNKLASAVMSPETEDSIKESSAKEAIELYKGEFLPGYYDEWIEELRTIMAHKYSEICEQLINLLRKNNKYDELLIYADKLIAADKLHEGAFTASIEAYNKTGNNAMAKKKFAQLLKNYDAEYGEKPSKKILAEIDAILKE